MLLKKEKKNVDLKNIWKMRQVCCFAIFDARQKKKSKLERRLSSETKHVFECLVVFNRNDFVDVSILEFSAAQQV